MLRKVKMNEKLKGKSKDLKERLYSFALRIVNFVKSLSKNWIAREIGKQLLHSGTSVAANYEEACGAFSKDDFIYKINTALKEARETHYWLRLIRDSNLIPENMDKHMSEAYELVKILTSIVKTSQGRK